jgi:hypothetical protein
VALTGLTPEELKKFAAGEFYFKMKGQGRAFKQEECDLYVEAYESAHKNVSRVEVPNNRPQFNPPLTPPQGMTV